MSNNLEIVNLSIVEEAKELMGDRFPTMVKYFLEDTEMYVSEIERGVGEKNAELALSPAHTIKSSAKQLGAERVSDLAKQIEAHCRDIQDGDDEDYEQLDRLFQDLKEEIEAATPMLEEIAGE